jgi:hypothetical protein
MYIMRRRWSIGKLAQTDDSDVRRWPMSQISKRLEQAVEAARAMTPDQQDLLAVEMLERARSLTSPPTRLSAQERVELEAELAGARRGELVSDEEVAAMYTRSSGCEGPYKVIE